MQAVVAIATPIVGGLAVAPAVPTPRAGVRGRGAALAGRAAVALARPEEGTLDERCEWWINRVGGFATVGATAASSVGPLADSVAVPDLLGAAAECLVACGIAREYGVTDPESLSRLVAHVILGRDDVQLVPGRTVEDRRTPPGGASLAREAVRLGLAVRSLTGEIRDRRSDDSARRGLLRRAPVVRVVTDFRRGRSTLAVVASRTRAWLEREKEGLDEPGR
ncbi:hypothetical protein [Pseudonocardia xishanensis]|uniref:hypothetical protein n=1 Tax=Pseudonocardia xishanensis TaxID=630995 RepID=UPI0031EE5BFB